MGAYKVLLVEDSDLMLAMISEYLRGKGFQIRSVSDAHELDPTFREWRPHVVVLDVHMPQITGPAACRALKSSLPALVPVVLFSSMEEAELARVARRCNADGFVSKRLGLARLAEELETLCGEIVW